MSLSNAMWDIFRHTGDISAYLAYKDFVQCSSGEDSFVGDLFDEDR